MDVEFQTLFILSLIAMLAGFIDAIAGGGGLITLPALLISGVAPVSAIATNKLQAAAATLSATIEFARKGLIQWKTAIPITFTSFIGGILGAVSVSLLSRPILFTIVPILLIIVAVYFLLTPKMSESDRPAKMSFFLFSLTVAPVLGFYDGIFGPGVGSFFLIGFIFLLGCKLINAMSYTKLANVSCNLGSLFFFISQGSIIFPLAISMAIGAFIGAHIGAKFALRFGSKLIKPLLITISLIMALKLFTDEDNLLYQFLSEI